MSTATRATLCIGSTHSFQMLESFVILTISVYVSFSCSNVYRFNVVGIIMLITLTAITCLAVILLSDVHGSQGTIIFTIYGQQFWVGYVVSCSSDFMRETELCELHSVLYFIFPPFRILLIFSFFYTFKNLNNNTDQDIEFYTTLGLPFLELECRAPKPSAICSYFHSFIKKFHLLRLPWCVYTCGSPFTFLSTWRILTKFVVSFM
jgi:hypothetical protein